MNELNHLIEDFLTKHSFNNIEILLNPQKIIKLDHESLVDKLITRNRGGYCFENNQYFFTLLKNNGYEVRRQLGRVVYGGSSEVPRTHQMSIVTIEQEKYLADVGFGPYVPGVAVPLSGREVESFNGSIYKIVNLNENLFELQVLRPEGFFSLYQFDLLDYNEADFKVANYYTNTHPDSKFTKSLTLSELSTKGVKFINNLTFTLIEDGKREEQRIDSVDKFLKVVQGDFKVLYTDDELIKLYEITSSL